MNINRVNLSPYPFIFFKFKSVFLIVKKGFGVFLCSPVVVASRGASQPAEGEKRHRQRAGALLAASAASGPVPGREQGIRPLGRNHQPARHVRLPPPDSRGLPHHFQAAQRAAASDPGGDARGEASVAGLKAAAAGRVYPEPCCPATGGEACSWKRKRPQVGEKDFYRCRHYAFSCNLCCIKGFPNMRHLVL